LQAQSGFTTIGGANFLGYGRAGVNVAGIESIYLNQAGLTDIKNMAIDISAEKRYNLSDLTNISIAGAKTFKFGTVGLLLSNFGFTEYNEQKFGLAYARKLSNYLSLGGQFDLLRYNILNVGSKNIFSFEVGMQLRLNKDFSFATHVFSPGNIEVTDGTEIGTRFRLGIKYAPSAKVMVLAEIDKVIDRKPEYKLALGYQAIDILQIRVGVNPTVSTYSFGAMIKFKDVYRIASAVALNNQLGNTPAISLQYQQ
jgi:hypothetical protein